MESDSVKTTKKVTTTRPNRFPVARVLAALVVVPFVSSLLVILFMAVQQVGNIVAPGLALGFHDLLAPAQVGSIVFLAFFFSWPGYLIFLVLGIPTIYILYRMGWRGSWVFVVVGICYTLLAWSVAGFGPHPAPGISRLRLVYFWEAFKLLCPVGVVNGLLTKVIVFGVYRRARNTDG